MREILNDKTVIDNSQEISVVPCNNSQVKTLSRLLYFMAVYEIGF